MKELPLACSSVLPKLRRAQAGVFAKSSREMRGVFVAKEGGDFQNLIVVIDQKFPRMFHARFTDDPPETGFLTLQTPVQSSLTDPNQFRNQTQSGCPVQDMRLQHGANTAGKCRWTGRHSAIRHCPGLKMRVITPEGA